jgi:2-methylcitrate dehydratase PrpD
MASEKTENHTTEVLARFAATVKYDEIPERVRECSKNLFLDALACSLAGYEGEELNQVSALASGLAQSRESSIIGGDRLSLAGATLLNGYLVTAATMCDVHRPTMTHVMPEVMSPALAIAERDSLSGRDLLVALVVGCETTTRIGIGLDYPAFRARGFHGPGVIGPFGAAAAVGPLLGFDPETMATAFGLAGSQAAGTFAAMKTPSVKFHQCRGALSGLMAALLAQQGFVATRQFLTAPDGGLFNSYSNGGCPEAVTERLGARWELEQIALRPWPSANVIYGFITAMFDLVEGKGVGFDQIKKVRIFFGQEAFERYGTFFRPKGKFEALIVPHYIAAVILHDRELSLAQFEPGRYNDPKLMQFAADRVEVKLDQTLADVQARVEADTVGGSTLTVRCDHPKGSPENPLSRHEIEGKFRTYAKTRLPDSRVEEVIGLVSRLEDLGSTRRLMDILRAV